MSGNIYQDVPALGQISNRRFIRRLEQWGAQVIKKNGEKTRLLMPDGCHLEVVSEHVKGKANSPQVFLIALDCLGVTWPDFLTKNVDPPAVEDLEAVSDLINTIVANAEKEAEEKRAKDEDKARRKAQAAADREAAKVQAASVPDHTPIAADAEPPQEAPRQPVVAQKPIGKPRPRGNNTGRIFDLLASKQEAMSIWRIGEELGLTNAQVSSACYRLVLAGVVKRLKSGVYQCVPEARHQDVRVDVVARTETDRSISQSVDIAPKPQPQVPVVTTPQTRAAAPMASATEDTINDVLDLMFPNGFRAQHLPMIDTWRKATADLIREINGS